MSEVILSYYIPRDVKNSCLQGQLPMKNLFALLEKQLDVPKYDRRLTFVLIDLICSPVHWQNRASCLERTSMSWFKIITVFKTFCISLDLQLLKFFDRTISLNVSTRTSP